MKCENILIWAYKEGSPPSCVNLEFLLPFFLSPQPTRHFKGSHSARDKVSLMDTLVLQSPEMGTLSALLLLLFHFVGTTLWKNLYFGLKNLSYSLQQFCTEVQYCPLMTRSESATLPNSLASIENYSKMEYLNKK